MLRDPPLGSEAVRDPDCVPCGVDGTQAELCWPDVDRFCAQWARILDVLREIISRVSLKEAAYTLGISDKALGHALAERERHYPRLDWLPAIAALALRCGMAEHLADALLAPLGMVGRWPEIPDAEWRRRVEAELRCRGDVGELIRKSAGVR